MIPRLWVCTSHPILQALSCPLQPLFILSLAVAAFLVGRRFGGAWAVRLRRLWVSLFLAWLVGLVMIALPGWIIVMIGGNGNPIFVAARYLWVVLAWGGVVVGLVWGQRAVARLPASLQAWAGRADVAGLFALSLLVVTLPRLFITDAQVPWSVPCLVADWIFDTATTNLASDECLAFRSQDDEHHLFNWDPGRAAMSRLKKSGLSAIPGIAAYLTDCAENPKQYAKGANCTSQQLLFLVAQGGDHPVLRVYEKEPVLQTREMRECLHRGGRVVWKSGANISPIACDR